MEPLESQVTEPVESVSPEHEQAILETATKTAEYIQNTFLKEGADISADFNKSTKRMVDTHIQQKIIGYVSEYLEVPIVTIDEAISQLDKAGLAINVVPTKHEFGEYSFSIKILKEVNERSYKISLKTDMNID